MKNTKTHYHICQKGMVVRITSQANPQHAITDIRAVTGEGIRLMNDVLDAAVQVLEHVARECGADAALAHLSLPSGRTLTLTTNGKSPTAYAQ